MAAMRMPAPEGEADIPNPRLMSADDPVSDTFSVRYLLEASG